MANPIGSPSNFPQGFANGINIRGMPLLQAQPGQIFYVNNSAVLNPQQHAGSDSSRGTFLDPLATLGKAVSLCNGGRGDIILIGAGHYETISSATALNITASGVAIIGLGAGQLRPTFSFDTGATSTITVSGAGVSIQNCLLVANFLNQASAFTGSVTSFTAVVSNNIMTTTAVTGNIAIGCTVFGAGLGTGITVISQLTGTANGAGTYVVSGTASITSTSVTSSNRDFSIDNCEFRDLSSSLNFLSIYTAGSTANASDGFQLTRSVWASLGTTSPTVALTVGAGQDRWNLSDNVMNSPITSVTQGPILMAASANNMTNITIARNRCQRPNTSSSIPCGISTSGTAWTGMAYDNYFGAVPTGTGIWINTGTKLSFLNNYSQITGAADKSALINPSAV